MFSRAEVWWRPKRHDRVPAQSWKLNVRLKGGLRGEVLSVSGQLVEQLGLLSVVIDKTGEPLSMKLHRAGFTRPTTPAEDESHDDGA